MKIKSLKYHDKSRHWKLKTTSFGNLTLLVGASGVGKTQILRSIQNIKRIANGESLSGVKWHIEFRTSDAENFVWHGEFENHKHKEENILIEKKGYQNKPKIVWEKLTQNENTIVIRDDQSISFNGKKTVKLPQEKSVINLLREETQIAVIEQSLLRLLIFNDTNTQTGPYLLPYHGDLFKRFSSIEAIRDSDIRVIHKLYLCSVKVPKIFTEIKENFISVFPFVEDVKVIRVKKMEDWGQYLYPLIQIREKGVENWIDEYQISLGMHRTLLQISNMYLCAEGTVFLIDEFENSLGVNCIDDLTSILLSHRRDLQFIITSHHPYIINNISYNNWKIVTRRGGVVTTHDASDFNLGKSKHKAFTQLINLDAYSEGVEI